VDSATPASVKRFQKLAKSSDTPLIVAAYDPPLALVRSLLRNGAVDVLPLPLDIVELETSIRQIQEQQGSSSVEAGKAGRTSNIVTVLKAAGGVGATTLVAQLAARFATNEAAHGREACLLDLDLQFGDAAFQLGMQTGLSVADLLAAGSRLDGSLIRATSTRHESGLHVISAPRELMPVEGHSSDDFIHIADAAAREFGTAFVELPTYWTNWSVSLIARSDLVLLVAELTITSLNRARRQLELLRAEGLGDLNVRVVINRFDKSQLRTIRASDVREALGYEISDTIANDPAIMRTASDRGVTIDQVKRKSTVGKDINLLDAGIAAALGLER
jgi:pilus assembly protein CpaE